VLVRSQRKRSALTCAMRLRSTTARSERGLRTINGYIGLFSGNGGRPDGRDGLGGGVFAGLVAAVRVCGIFQHGIRRETTSVPNGNVRK
jgi:hypothetical protein